MTPLTRKLSRFTALSTTDRIALDRLSDDARTMSASAELISEGDQPSNVFLLVEGWACRYKVLADGSRQIMAYLIPGDLCDIHIFILSQMDHSISFLGPGKAAAIPKQTMLDLLRDHPMIAQALFWATLVDEAILREWLVNLGQRDAYERIAHLFCEMSLRLKTVGLTDRSTLSLPLTQAELGDTMGLTPVHVNRTLGRMRKEGLISLSGHHLVIHDIKRLEGIAGFNPNYLHLEAAR